VRGFGPGFELVLDPASRSLRPLNVEDPSRVKSARGDATQ